MLLLSVCNQQQVQNFLIILPGNVNRIKLLILIAEYVNIYAVLSLNSSIMFDTDRKLHTLINSILAPFFCSSS